MTSGTLDPERKLYFLEKPAQESGVPGATPTRGSGEPGSAPVGIRSRRAANDRGWVSRPGSAGSADELLQDYISLTRTERERFLLLWNQTEEEFDLRSLRALNLHVNKLGVNLSDRGAFERALGLQAGQAPVRQSNPALPGQPARARLPTWSDNSSGSGRVGGRSTRGEHPAVGEDPGEGTYSGSGENPAPTASEPEAGPDPIRGGDADDYTSLPDSGPYEAIGGDPTTP